MSSPFLFTTGLTEFWDTKAAKIIVLGAWCLRYDTSEKWKDLDFDLLPYLWDSSSEIKSAFGYQNDVYEEALEILSGFMNELHLEKHTRRYWRIILGPWLLHYIQTLHERYLCLKLALSKYPDLTTLALAHSSYKIPRYYWDHLRASTSDSYNLQLYSVLLRAMGVAVPEKELSWTWDDWGSKAAVSFSRSFKTNIRAVLKRMTPFWAKRRRVLLVDMHLPFKQVLQLMAKTRFDTVWCDLPVPDSFLETQKNDIHFGRKDLVNIVPRTDDEFRSILFRTLPVSMPLIYMEGYKALRQWVKTNWRTTAVKTILTANAFEGNETFKFLAAELMERGTRLISVQHGGCYGSANLNPVEGLELKAADEYWSWGWESLDHKVKSVPSLSLSRIVVKKKPPTEDILFVGNTFPRYHYRTWSCPTASQWLNYLEWVTGFIRKLQPEIREKLIYRPHPNDFGWSLPSRLRNACPDLKISMQGDYYEAVLSSRLVVCDMNQTTILEGLAANIPTLAFWNPKLWELRPEATVFFEKLQQAGILHFSFEGAARQLNEVWPSISEWWSSSLVQENRQFFIEHYALASPDWLENWAECLKIAAVKTLQQQPEPHGHI